MWELEQTILGHTPGSEQDATRMSMRIRDIIDELHDQLLLAQGLISKKQIEERRAAEDGVMRVIA